MIPLNITKPEDTKIIPITNAFIPNQFCSSLSDINKQNDCGWTPLYRTIIAGDLQASELLIKFGANPNIQCNMGETSLFQAVDMDKTDHVKLLLKHKADPNITNSDGHTPLHQAVIKQNVGIVEILLSNAANPNTKCKFFEMTPVHFAIKNNVNPTILLLLVQYNGSLVVKDKNDKRPIDYVNSDEMRETLKKLRLQKEDIFRTPSKDRPISFTTPSKMMTVMKNFGGNNHSESGKREFDIYGNTVTKDAGNNVYHFMEVGRKGGNGSGQGQGQPPSCSNSKKKTVNDVKRRNEMNMVKCDLFQKSNEGRNEEEDGDEKTMSNIVMRKEEEDFCRNWNRNKNRHNTEDCYRYQQLQQLQQQQKEQKQLNSYYYYTTEKKTKVYSPIKESKEEEYYHDTDISKSIIIKSKRSMKTNRNDDNDDGVDIIKEKMLERNLMDTKKDTALLSDSIHLLSHHNINHNIKKHKHKQSSNSHSSTMMNKENINSANIGSNAKAITIINLQTNPLNHSNHNLYLHSSNSNNNTTSNQQTLPQYPNNSFTILSPRDNLTTILLKQPNANPNPLQHHHESLSYNTQSLPIPIDSSKLFDWLCQINLQFYYPLFIDKGIYSLDKIIEDMHSETIVLTYKDISSLGIKKPGHVYRILIKLEIDASLINRKIAEFICPLNYSNPKATSMRISKEYMCCCGVSQQHSTTKPAMNFDMNGWLKNASLEHLKENFEFNGFELMQYFVLQMFSSVPVDDEIILECLHVYDEKERDRVIMELNRNVRYVVKKVNYQMSSMEMIGEKEETSCKMCVIF